MIEVIIHFLHFNVLFSQEKTEKRDGKEEEKTPVHNFELETLQETFSYDYSIRKPFWITRFHR